MVKYLNASKSTHTFYSVTIKPGEVKEFPGYINVKCMVHVSDDTPVSTDKKSSTSSTTKKSVESGIKSAENSTISK